MNATPLITLDAVALDTETTGLDVAKDRIVEIGALRLRGAQLKIDGPFRRLVQPGIPVPKQVLPIHGIDDAALIGAPSFREVWPLLRDYLRDDVVIGYATGFDLALLKHEVQRVDQAWAPPRFLDVKLLARIAAPDLRDYSLDALAAHFSIEITQRHSALGDARAAADIFAALIPMLRERGVRTLAEAMRACSDLSSRQDASPAPWSDHDETPADVAPEFIGGSGDTFPFRHSVGSVMSAPAQWVDANVPLASALAIMAQRKLSSVFIEGAPGRRRPEDSGIITERDILRALDTHGTSALTFPVKRVMSAPLSCVPQSSLAYVAVGRMKRLGFRHLGVTDDAGFVTGALSARDLLRLRAQGAVELSDALGAASDTADLARAWGQIIPTAAELRRDGMAGVEVAAVISQEVIELSRAAVRLAEQTLGETGGQGPPCPYCFVVLGSAGRGESLLAMDQDNALIFSDDAPPEADRWFRALAEATTGMLHAAGVPFCKGGIMAKNQQWRGSLSAWRQRVTDWVGRSNPQDLLAVDIFFDLKPVYGDASLVEMLRSEAFDAAKGNVAFAKSLREAAGEPEPGRNWFGGFRTVAGRIDLKKTGLFGLVTSARALAICHHVLERSTPARLRALKALLPHASADVDALIEAHGVFLDLILKQQLLDAERGRPISNSVEVRLLSGHERRRLRSALAATEHISEFTRSLMFEPEVTRLMPSPPA
jgi:DNA polymerase-3 subunit epsilon/CBS domain-containing protein